MLRPYRKPLVVFTPKSLLRSKDAASPLQLLAEGSFQTVIPEADAVEAAKVKRLIVCSGKVYFDLVKHRRENGIENTPVIRLEQLYPFPHDEFAVRKNCASLLGKPMPKGLANVIGIVQQYQSSSPYSSGYEIVPLDSSSVIAVNITPIDSLKENGSTGIPLMVNDTINTTGIVTSILQMGTGTAGPATIQNSNTGISAYGSVFTQAAGLQIGDSVIINNWKVSNYNGLNELATTANSNVQIISSGHKVNPIVITIPQISQGWNGFEKYEGMLVQLNNVTFADTATQFRLLSGKSYGQSYIVNNTDTVEFYFTKNCPSLLGKPMPKGLANVIGIVQQYQSSSPYSSGYEIVPLDSSSVYSNCKYYPH